MELIEIGNVLFCRSVKVNVHLDDPMKTMILYPLFLKQVDMDIEEVLFVRESLLKRGILPGADYF